MSLLVAIILGIIIIPIYAYFWASIYRWENNRRIKRNNFKPMTKKQFNLNSTRYLCSNLCYYCNLLKLF
ncbi:hypothetical protein SCO01_03840 [Staphylococcus cohnii subsp. cohnii]|nr:hypothetical protein SCO01_03840 [Staphylococcus cohnii subsp. cohnii]